MKTQLKHSELITFFISERLSGVPTITELRHALDASIDCTRDGRHIAPFTQHTAIIYYLFIIISPKALNNFQTNLAQYQMETINVS